MASKRKPFEYMSLDKSLQQKLLSERRARLIEATLWSSRLLGIEVEPGLICSEHFQLKLQLPTKGKLRPVVRWVADLLAELSRDLGLRIEFIGRPTQTTLLYWVFLDPETRRSLRTVRLTGRAARRMADLDNLLELSTP